MAHEHPPFLTDEHELELGHDDGHVHDVPLAVVEEPLDPANQSLADALRASFRVLKVVMLLLIVIFLFSGVFMVDQNEVVVLSRLGKPTGPPSEPGLHFAFPYPIDAKVRVPVAPRTIFADAFWLRLSEADKTRDLSQVGVPSGGLDPATNGALITGDHAIMHLLIKAQYRITGANDFVRNVSDETALLLSVLQNAAVAEAARTTADVVWKEPSKLTAAIRIRAQSELDSLQSGITFDGVAAEKSHYPLQTREEFLAVPEAENRMRKLIQEANTTWEEKLKGAAGPAWEPISREIEKLDQTNDESKRDEIFQNIENLLLSEQTTGEAGRKIKLAEGTRDKMVAEAHANADRFATFLEAYKKNPELVRQRLKHDMLNQIFSQTGISRWVLPSGEKFIILNKNPEEIRQQEVDRIRKKSGLPPSK